MTARKKEQHLTPLYTSVAVTLPSGYDIPVRIEHGDEEKPRPYWFQFGNTGSGRPSVADVWWSDEDLDALVELFAELKARRARG